MNTPKWLIVHHTAVGGNSLQFDSVNIYHKNKFNFISSLGYYVGYQYFIEKNGEIKQARQDNEEGAHTIGYNNQSIGICLAGNFDIEIPTETQKSTLQSLLQTKVEKYSVSPNNIVPHRKFAHKSCYGNNLSDDWAKNLLIEQKKIDILKALVDAYQKLISLLKK